MGGTSRFVLFMYMQARPRIARSISAAMMGMTGSALRKIIAVPPGRPFPSKGSRSPGIRGSFYDASKSSKASLAMLSSSLIFQ